MADNAPHAPRRRRPHVTIDLDPEYDQLLRHLSRRHNTTMREIVQRSLKLFERAEREGRV